MPQHIWDYQTHYALAEAGLRPDLIAAKDWSAIEALAAEAAALLLNIMHPSLGSAKQRCIMCRGYMIHGVNTCRMPAKV